MTAKFRAMRKLDIEEQAMVQALEVEPEKRSHEQREDVLKWARGHPSFQKLRGHCQHVSLEPLTDALESVLFPSQSIVFEQGEPGDSFYIVLAGQVGMLPKSSYPSTLSLEPPTYTPNFEGDARKMRSTKRLHVPRASKEIAPSTRFLLGKENPRPSIILPSGNYRFVGRWLNACDCSAVSEKGGAFGELALIQGIPRSLSVVALCDAILIKISRVEFLKIADAESEKEREREKQKFIRDALPAGYDCTIVRLRRLTYEFYEAEVSKGTTLQKQGSLPTKVWIVSHGEVRVELKGKDPTRPIALALCGRGMLVGELRQESIECSYGLTVSSATATLLSMPWNRFFVLLERQGTQEVEAMYARHLKAWKAQCPALGISDWEVFSPRVHADESSHQSPRALVFSSPSRRPRRKSPHLTPRGDWLEDQQEHSPRGLKLRWDPGAAQFGTQQTSESRSALRSRVVHVNRRGKVLARHSTLDTAMAPLGCLTRSLKHQEQSKELPSLSPRSPRATRSTTASPRAEDRNGANALPASAVTQRKSKLINKLMQHHQADAAPQLPALAKANEPLRSIDQQVVIAALSDPDQITALARQRGLARLLCREDLQQ